MFHWTLAHLKAERPLISKVWASPRPVEVALAARALGLPLPLEALTIASFEPGSGKVEEAKKIFDSLALPGLEMQLAEKPASELVDAFNVLCSKGTILSHKHSEQIEASAKASEELKSQYLARAENAEAQQKEHMLKANEAILVSQNLSLQLEDLGSNKRDLEIELSGLRKNAEASDANLLELQLINQSDKEEISRLRNALAKAEHLYSIAIAEHAEKFEPKTTEASEAFRQTFAKLGSSIGRAAKRPTSWS
ncbi:uncharacterized protein LOC133903734 [Phragmites australis]|uniref:uncharacterized protein LOC133903734 n=1 Tax=Phragmites australis TaxID=29695 RepID=UPI002D7A3521|nr:uncharacterized protein LOC133903734 [Phragmites australis]